MLFLSRFCAHPYLHSFPTRRSSDLVFNVTFDWRVLAYAVGAALLTGVLVGVTPADRKSTRLNSSHQITSYAVLCLKKKTRLHPTETKESKYLNAKAAMTLSDIAGDP